MTAYNVVGSASMVGGEPEDISVVLANFDAIASVLANLDDGNIKAAAGIAASKLANFPNDPTKVLKGDGNWAGVPGADLTYEGDYVPATTYQDGDVVVKDGIAYLCVGGPTVVAPDPAPWGGAIANRPAGDLDYVERTTTLNVSATTAAGADEFIASNPITLDGSTRIRIEFFVPITEASQYIQTTLWDGSTDLGILTDTSMGGTTIDVAAMAVRYLTPSAGTHTFRIKAFRGTGAGTLYAGSGGSNGYVPACLRISRVDPVFIAPAGPTVLTYGLALPSSPADGQEHILVDSLTAATYRWRFRFNAARSSNKWEFIGGAPAYVMVGAGSTEYMTSTSFIALTTAGPSIVIPVAGDYLVGLGIEIDNDSGGGRMSYDIGATPAADADHVGADAFAAATNYPNLYGERRKSLPAATLTAKYRVTTGGTAGFRDRFMKVIPIAVGG